MKGQIVHWPNRQKNLPLNHYNKESVLSLYVWGSLCQNFYKVLAILLNTIFFVTSEKFTGPIWILLLWFRKTTQIFRPVGPVFWNVLLVQLTKCSPSGLRLVADFKDCWYLVPSNRIFCVCFVGDVEPHINLCMEVVPEWLSSVQIKKGRYLKIDRNIDLQQLTDKVNNLVKSAKWFSHNNLNNNLKWFEPN